MPIFLAAIRFFRSVQLNIPLPCCVAGVFVLVVILAGALYAGGMIRRETYIGMMIALLVLFVLMLLAAAGYVFFVRRTHVW